MKYIKTFENQNELIPYQMYRDTSRMDDPVVCYVGNNGTTYPLLCLLFQKNHRGNYHFIDWIEWVKKGFKPMNIDIKDYIINNDIVSKTLKDIDKKDFSSGPSGIDKKLIKDLKKYLLSDDRIKIIHDVEKYNL